MDARGPAVTDGKSRSLEASVVALYVDIRQSKAREPSYLPSRSGRRSNARSIEPLLSSWPSLARCWSTVHVLLEILWPASGPSEGL